MGNHLSSSSDKSASGLRTLVAENLGLERFLLTLEAETLGFKIDLTLVGINESMSVSYTHLWKRCPSLHRQEGQDRQQDQDRDQGQVERRYRGQVAICGQQLLQGIDSIY